MPTELPTIFLVVAPQDNADWCGRRIYTVHHSNTGMTHTLRRQHSGDAVARVRGCGFDVTGALLADALTAELGVPSFDGARGVSSVVRHAEAHGVRVVTLSDALYALPTAAELDGERVAR